MPDAQNGVWGGDAWAAYSGGGGGGCTDLTAPATPLDPEDLAAGTTALGSTSVGSWSASVTVTCSGVDEGGSAAPTMTPSGSGAGPYTVSIASGLSNDKQYSYRIRGEAADGQIADTYLMVSVAAAASGPSTVIATADFGDYDFTTTGGTGGSGGAGPHTLPDGTTCTVHVVGTGATVAKVEGGVFVGDGDTSNYYNIEFDLGADIEWVPVWTLAQWTLGESAGSGSLWFKSSEIAGDDANKTDDLQCLSLGSTSIRFRFLNSATTFNNVLDITGLTLGSADQLEVRIRSTSAWATVEGRQGAGSMPSWKGAVMSDVNGDVRNALPSNRRYLYVRVGGQDASMNLLVQKGL